jgi:hypothetical protein
MYICRVSFKEVVVELALIVQGTVVLLELALKVIFVDVPHVGASNPIYANPIGEVSLGEVTWPRDLYRYHRRQELRQPRTHTQTESPRWC